MNEIEKMLLDQLHKEIRSLLDEVEMKKKILIDIIAETNSCVDPSLSSQNFAKIRNLARRGLNV